MTQEKFCPKCKEVKNKSDFYKNKKYKDGLCRVCKNCDQIYRIKYKRSYKGLINDIYYSQIKSSKDRGHKPPLYTKNELYEWVINHNNFKNLYLSWVSSAYNKWLKPSVDRIDDYKGYSFDNIQLVTWNNNLHNVIDNIKAGKNNKQSRAVLQYDLNGNFIKKYYSIRQAGRETNSNCGHIIDVCKGRLNHTNSYCWKYAY